MAVGGFSLPLVDNHDGGMHRVDADGSMVVNTTNFHHRPSMTPPLKYMYGVTVGVGMGRGKGAYFLVLDTASSLMWMQCEHCLPDLPQHGSPVFDPDHLSTYRPLHPTSPLCRRPNPIHPAGDKCSFHLTEANGFVSTNTIMLGNPNLPIHGIAFECAHTTQGFENQRTFAGRLGMGKLPTSLIMQIKDCVAWCFSYCLIAADAHTQGWHGFIHFGADIPEARLLDHHIMNIRPPPPGAIDSAYYVKLLEVSLNGLPIPGIHPSMFERRRDGSGGCLVNTGIPYTYLVPPAYAHVEESVARVLQQWRYERVHNPNFPLCFRENPRMPYQIPRLTFHFEGPANPCADLEIPGPRLFFKLNNKPLVCFGVFPFNRKNVIGVMLQIDTRFIFDLQANTITFHPERCDYDTAAIPSEW